MVSCSDDDDASSNADSSVNMSKLTKKWYYVSDQVNGVTFPYDDHEACGKDYIEFLEDGTAITADVYECNDGQPAVEEIELPYTVDGKKISINLMGTALTATVKELNDTRLVVEVEEDYDENGTIDRIKQTYTSQP